MSIQHQVSPSRSQNRTHSEPKLNPNCTETESKLNSNRSEIHPKFCISSTMTFFHPFIHSPTSLSQHAPSLNVLLDLLDLEFPQSRLEIPNRNTRGQSPRREHGADRSELYHTYARRASPKSLGESQMASSPGAFPTPTIIACFIARVRATYSRLLSRSMAIFFDTASISSKPLGT